jgi:ABC-2 type transport system permease protein
MHRIFAIAGLHLKEFFQSPGAWVLMVIMPCIFGIVFGGMAVNSEKNKPVVNVVVGSADDHVTKQVVNLLTKNDQYQWEKTSRSNAKKNVLEEDAIAAVVIPKDIGKRITENKPLFDIIITRKSEDYLGLSQHLDGTARLVYQSYQTAESLGVKDFSEMLKAVSVSKGVKIDQEIMKKNEDDSKAAVNLMFIGFAVMFMMFGISGAASTILDERSGGTWARLLISPATRLEIISGYILNYFLMGWIQFVVLMVIMNLLFDTTWGSLVYLIPFASLVILSVVGFGLMIAGMVKTKQQAGAISAVLIVSTCMLGGVYWPLDFVPDIMQKIALGVPQSWAMSGFEEIVSGSLHTGTLVKDTLALVGFSVVFFLIGLRLIKYE